MRRAKGWEERAREKDDWSGDPDEKDGISRDPKSNGIPAPEQRPKPKWLDEGAGV